MNKKNSTETSSVKLAFDHAFHYVTGGWVVSVIKTRDIDNVPESQTVN